MYAKVADPQAAAANCEVAAGLPGNCTLISNNCSEISKQLHPTFQQNCILLSKKEGNLARGFRNCSGMLL
jgi:hypothetical protein